MTNDYPESYKVSGEQLPPKPQRFRGSLNLREMVDRLTPQNAKSVLTFIQAQNVADQLPPDVIEKLVAKTCQLPPDPAPTEKKEPAPREASAQAPPPSVVEVGSGDVLFPPEDGVFPDGSRLDDKDIPF